MSAASSPPPPVPLATWNSARGVWETPQASLLCGHSVPYSDPWPTSGTTRSGSCYAPPTSEHRTAASGPSSPPGPPDTLLKTPTSNIGKNGGSQHPSKRKSGGHGPNLADEVEWLLPTPKASDGTKGSPNQRHGNGDMTLPSAAASLLPTDTPGRHTPRGSRPPLSTVTLPLWAENSPEAGERTGDGERTQPPSPDGRASPVPHPSPPTQPAGSAPTSSSGCRASTPAGSPPPRGSGARRSSPRSATASSRNKPLGHCSCWRRPSRAAPAVRARRRDYTLRNGSDSEGRCLTDSAVSASFDIIQSSHGPPGIPSRHTA
jgi:hypothetical protein